MVYRDSPDALHARIARLEEELAGARAELDALRERYTRAMAALRVIAHSKKVATALEGSKLTPEELARLAKASELPPAPAESKDPPAKPDTKTASKKRRAKKPTTKKKVEPARPKKPSKRGGKPAGEGVYVLVDRKTGV